MTIYFLTIKADCVVLFSPFSSFFCSHEFLITKHFYRRAAHSEESWLAAAAIVTEVKVGLVKQLGKYLLSH